MLRSLDRGIQDRAHLRDISLSRQTGCTNIVCLGAPFGLLWGALRLSLDRFGRLCTPLAHHLLLFVFLGCSWPSFVSYSDSFGSLLDVFLPSRAPWVLGLHFELHLTGKCCLSTGPAHRIYPPAVCPQIPRKLRRSWKCCQQVLLRAFLHTLRGSG